MKTFSSHKIQFNDGTELIVIENNDKTIDILLTHADISIKPLANNHIQIKKEDIRVPKSTIEQLKKEGIIK